ncbi:hypothetical protein FCULG_00000224 [Fusarium culmorum]|uniref:Pal1 cell morphology protein n=1 Tax=Fusarium culmorum TaxID=5516 RepID=A0A2T4GPW8_FUSCU|nr:hypothetical protein FCULG_00000224 [Fusarium culmorum]
MTDTSDKQWAKAYLLDPLNEPEPNQDTGIGNLSAQFRSYSLESSNSSSSKDNSKDSDSKNKHRSRKHRHGSYPTPPHLPVQLATASIPQTPSPTLQLRDVNHLSPRSRSLPQTLLLARQSPTRSIFHPSAVQPALEFLPIATDLRFSTTAALAPATAESLEARAADRAPHLRRKQMPMTDTIDALDTIGGTYHHGGPYDATLASRNRNKKYSPVAAVEESNREALRATPRENIQDSLKKKMPLQGTAVIPSGERDFSGNTINYEEGADLMREPDAMGGAYKRWDGIQYHPDDLKGKGEPSYTYEKDLKEHKRNRGGPAEYELSSNMGTSQRPAFTHNRSFSENPEQPQSRHKLSDGLRKRFGSIRRKKVGEVQ